MCVAPEHKRFDVNTTVVPQEYKYNKYFLSFLSLEYSLSVFFFLFALCAFEVYVHLCTAQYGNNSPSTVLEWNRNWKVKEKGFLLSLSKTSMEKEKQKCILLLAESTDRLTQTTEIESIFNYVCVGEWQWMCIP